ncbi:PREDICTED: paralemmin-3 [Condylura cristata]|uniref:paralemmin-3 n=1 Tax=Condylura cristata TaxID=143302 RepID=UPI000642B255|nr:PREDICTED: paralemmin-3 [Condylura cristata]
MALESQVWAPATPMPVAESSLYRQRLEVIALYPAADSHSKVLCFLRLISTDPHQAGRGLRSILGAARPAPSAPPLPLLSQRVRSPLPALPLPLCASGGGGAPSLCSLSSRGSPRSPAREVGARRIKGRRRPHPTACSSGFCAQEKRRLQEEIRAVRRELEEEKLRVERLKRKSLRERWLMDGAAEGPEQLEDPTSQDLQSPEGQAQARIQDLEDSLFTLQSQLQLLQSASTGALHKPGRPIWRKQGHRPLSQLNMETDPPGQTDLNKRASLPAGLVGTSTSEPRVEIAEVPPDVRLAPAAAGPPSEANGPCPEPSNPLSPGVAEFKGVVGETREGGMVKVVWEGLRATEDCATEATGPELEAKVEEMVLEAIGERQEADQLELPAWVKEDRGIVEVIWEGVGGPDDGNSEATGEAGRGPEAAPTGSPKIQEGIEGAASHEGEGASRSSPDGDRQGGSGAVEGSFIWVERVTLTEEWEELQVEGVGGPRVTSREGDESPLGAEERGVEESWEVEKSRAEQSGEKGNDKKAGTEWEGEERSLVGERKGSEESFQPEGRGNEKTLSTERKEVADRERGKAPLEAEKTEEEKRLEEVEKPPVMERRDEISLKVEKGGGEALKGEREGQEEELKVGREGGEEALKAEREGEEALKVEGGGEEAREVDGEGGEEALKVERGGEATLESEGEGGEEVLLVGTKRDEEELEATQEPLVSVREGEASRKAVRGSQETLQAEQKGDEALEAGNTQGPSSEEGLSVEEQRESGEATESQVEEVSEAGVALRATKEPGPEEESQPQELEASPEKTAMKLQTPAEGRGPLGDTTPLLVKTAAPDQPPECQPLLQVEGPSAHPVPTYAPDRHLEPSASPEGEEVSVPKQKTCQCCAVM